MKLAAALVAFAATVLPDWAFSQDKKLEAVCGNLFGARLTAVRLMQEGWPAQQIVEDAINRPEWRNASMQDRKLLMDLLQETFLAPMAPSSEVIRDCMRRAEAAPKSQ
jgi:hypothetical protein